MRDFASIFPVTIVSRLLGIPPNSDRERRFKSLADSAVVAFNPMCSEEDKLRSIHSFATHLEEVRELMEEKRRNPGDDLMTDMIEAETAGDRFTPGRDHLDGDGDHRGRLGDDGELALLRTDRADATSGPARPLP